MFALIGLTAVVCAMVYLVYRKTAAPVPPAEPKPEDPPPAPKPYRLTVTRTAAKGVKEAVSWVQDMGIKTVYEEDGKLTPTPKLLADLWLANVCTEFFFALKAMGIVEIRHFGIYNYRVVAGTTTLSKHAMALAIDVSGFVFGNGTVVSVKKDWPTEGSKGAVLRTIRHIAGNYFDAVLDPDFNAAHHDHFHCELNPAKRPQVYLFSGRYERLPITALVDFEDCEIQRACDHA